MHSRSDSSSTSFRDNTCTPQLYSKIPCIIEAEQSNEYWLFDNQVKPLPVNRRYNLSCFAPHGSDYDAIK